MTVEAACPALIEKVRTTVLDVNTTVGAGLLQPRQILDARLLKFGVQINF